MKLTYSIFSCLAISLLVSVAQAEVIEKSAHGFQVKHQVEVAVPREVAYSNFHAAIGQWWDSAHTWSRDASNLSLKPEAGASFLESLPNGGSCQHLEVVFVKPAEAIRLVGGLGPLQNEGVNGSLTITFKELGEGRTKMTWSYHVGGFVPQGLDAWAAPVDQVISLQCDRLKRYCETGKP